MAMRPFKSDSEEISRICYKQPRNQGLGFKVSKNVEPLLVMENMQHGSLYDLVHNNTMQVQYSVNGLRLGTPRA